MQRRRTHSASASRTHHLHSWSSASLPARTSRRALAPEAPLRLRRLRCAQLCVVRRAALRRCTQSPWMTSSFGPATVHLIHPEQQLLASPGVYSYRAEPYGTYPDWFDTTYFNERIIPHLNPPALLQRDAVAPGSACGPLSLQPHPEAWILLTGCSLVALGASALRRAGAVTNSGCR